MSYKVIVDSCGELTPEMKASGIFETWQKQQNVPSLLVHHRKNIWKSMTVMWIGCTQ